MLDQSIPYYNIIMKRPSGADVPEAQVKSGYSFISFSEGDELDWAKIMVSVGEFDDFQEALDYFKKDYLSQMEALKHRSFFIQNSEGEKIGTLTNWWNYSENRKEPSVHWVGVLPKYQGQGLGKALIFEGTKRLIALEGDRDFYLHTQTWSYKAITLYRKAGYKVEEFETFGGYQNDYKLAASLLKEYIGLIL